MQRVIDSIYKALAPVLPNDFIAGNSATFRFARFLACGRAVNTGSFSKSTKARTAVVRVSDGPDRIEN